MIDRPRHLFPPCWTSGRSQVGVARSVVFSWGRWGRKAVRVVFEARGRGLRFIDKPEIGMYHNICRAGQAMIPQGVFRRYGVGSASNGCLDGNSSAFHHEIAAHVEMFPESSPNRGSYAD